jgi:hypothetical protein
MIIVFFLAHLMTGEILEYEAKWSFLTLGSMTLELVDTTQYQGHSCYHIRSLLNSNPSLSFLFSLHDTIDVFTTTDELLPIIYQEDINEGNYHNHASLAFDHENLVVEYNDTLRIDLLDKTRDLLSFWYYLRTIELAVGDTISLNIHASQENHAIKCYVKKQGIVKTSLGEFDALLVLPETKGKGIFGSDGGMDIWYSRDDFQYPVLIKAYIKKGSILFKLKEVRY